MGKGLFISLEGGEKTGKSTQHERLVSLLRGHDIPCTAAYEPGGTPLGERLRDLLLHDRLQTEMTPVSEALLYAASRGQLVAERLRPALEEGRIVVCDRYVDSSLAYQGYGLGIDLDFLRRINTAATGGLTPDVTILFDNIDGDERQRRSDSEADRIEERDVAFHRRVQRGYRQLAAADADRYELIDAGQPVEAVWSQVTDAIAPNLRAAGWRLPAPGADDAAEPRGDADDG